MNYEEDYILGQKAGAVFVDKVDEMFKEFRKNYEVADPNFDNDHYMNGFWSYFLENVGFAD